MTGRRPGLGRCLLNAWAAKAARVRQVPGCSRPPYELLV